MEFQDELFNEAPGTITPDLQNAEITYYPTFIERNESDSLLRDLQESVEWRQDKITFYGKVHDIPRLTAWFGDPGRNYNYSNIQMNPVAWTPTISKLKETVERVSNHSFNSLLLNYYRDGNDKVSWHSDDEKELGLNPTIASISLGAERKFKLRHKTKKELKHEIVLKHGSLLLMAGETQHHWEHEIPKTAVKIGPRINLTFRTVE